MDAVKWQELLGQAVSEPGKMSECYKRFWNYSVGNQIMVMFQCAQRGIELGPVASYGGWLKLGRQVKKGEKALAMFMPVMGKKKEEGKEDEKFMFFVLKNHWFVISQTEGDAYVEPQIPGWDKDLALKELGIMEKPFTDINGNCQGYARPKKRELAINPLAEHASRTLFHEMAHVLLHDADVLIDGGKMPKTLVEAEAECTAMLVSASFGEDVSESRAYVQDWWGKNPIPPDSCKRIMGAATKIIRSGQMGRQNASD
jgi:hypothetical protein